MEPQVINHIANTELNRLGVEGADLTDSRVTAITKAARNLSGGIIANKMFRDHLAVQSASDPRVLHVATRDTCTCPAYTLGDGRYCWHRAAWGLVNKYNRIANILNSEAR